MRSFGTSLLQSRDLNFRKEAFFAHILLFFFFFFDLPVEISLAFLNLQASKKPQKLKKQDTFGRDVTAFKSWSPQEMLQGMCCAALAVPAPAPRCVFQEDRDAPSHPGWCLLLKNVGAGFSWRFEVILKWWGTSCLARRQKMKKKSSFKGERKRMLGHREGNERGNGGEMF